MAEGRGTPAYIASQLGSVASWGRQHERRMFVGEFGVLKANCGAADRCRWLETVRRACETNGMGWAHWEYQSIMGFATGAPGLR